MNILKDVIGKMDEYDHKKSYWDYTPNQREKIVEKLWDEVYGGYYKNSLMGRTISNPLSVQHDILEYLFFLLEEHKLNEDYEVCDVIEQLITITEIKTQELDAITRKETSRK